MQLTLGLETVANAVGQVIGAIPRAIKGAIDHADALSKAAQKAGTTTEALSKLAYAASFSDVGLEDLTSSMGKLSKSMTDAVTNSASPAATAFKALGISVKDSSGHLRDSDAVFADVSDRFSRMEDGATKTSLAMMIFGKSGANLIPLLNGGADELKRYADEADRLHITLSTKTGKSAERFNDTLGVVGQVLQGVVNQMMEAALPALQDFAQMLASPDFAKAAATLASNVITALTMITDAITGIINMLGDLTNKMTDALNFAMSGATTRTSDQLKKDLEWWQNKAANPDISDSDRKIGVQKMSEINAELARRAAGPDASGNVSPTSFDFRTLLDKPKGGSGGGGSALDPTLPNAQADQAAKAYQKVITAANQRIAQSQVEAAALGQTAEQADKLRFANDLLSQATENGTQLTADQQTQLYTLADSMAAAAENTRELTDLYNTGNSVLGSFFSDLKSDLMDGTNLWASFADAAGKALNSIADKVLEMAANGIWNMIFNAITGGLTGGTSLLGGISGSSASLGILTPNIGHRVMGGSVNLGSPYMVGENGPELFVPRAAGTIMPNKSLGGGNGGQTSVLIQLDPSLRASILSQAADQSVQIVKSGSPAAVATANRNKTS